MAKIVEVIRGRVVKPPVERIVLELTGDEAEILFALTGRISGENSSVRPHLTAVRAALGGSGIDKVAFLNVSAVDLTAARLVPWEY